ncbi:hypothetical protein BS17DRAFT_798443 [Gyrodon lividus]|nr:hypothetical protein BS17DRAFT_798443 [Gyrodon lividus]
MLWEKCKSFEEELQIPEKERLSGDRWLQSFCKTYKICEYQWHGEARSVDTDAVQVEQEHSPFPYAPPDCGLATKQMSGKKKEKFRITIGFGCNADGSEKLEPFFIGRAKKPQCFKKQGPMQCGFSHWHNKKAWIDKIQ